MSEKKKVVPNQEILTRAKEMGVEVPILDDPSKLGMGDAIFLARYRGRYGVTQTWPEHRPSPARRTAQSDWSIEGFLQALGRLKDTIAQGNVEPVETFIPLFETLHWVGSAKFGSGLEGRELKLTRAIRFARNRVNRRWAKALRLQDMPFPTLRTNLAGAGRIAEPPLVATWCWRHADELPIPKGSKVHEKKSGARLYRKHLAERPALEALDAIGALLVRQSYASSSPERAVLRVPRQ